MVCGGVVRSVWWESYKGECGGWVRVSVMGE